MAKDSLRERAGQVREEDVAVPEFISQAEIIEVIRLRILYKKVGEQLEFAQTGLLHKLEGGAEMEYGYYMARETNRQLEIWEGDSLKRL